MRKSEERVEVPLAGDERYVVIEALRRLAIALDAEGRQDRAQVARGVIARIVVRAQMGTLPAGLYN